MKYFKSNDLILKLCQICVSHYKIFNFKYNFHVIYTIKHVYKHVWKVIYRYVQRNTTA